MEPIIVRRKLGRKVINSSVKLERRSHVTARNVPSLTVGASRFMRAIRYCMLAQREEMNGFPLAAAQEWRNAAESFGPIASMADRCWMEWERIMQLPRYLANPIV